MGKQSGAPAQYGPQGPGTHATPGGVGGPIGQVGQFLGLQAPDSQNYYGAATQTGLANRPNISGPFSNQEWTVDSDGQWHLTNRLGGNLGSASVKLGNQAADSLSTPFDLSSLGAMPDASGVRQQAQDAAYAQAQKRLDPMFDKREEALRTRLINQGLDPTSEAAKGANEQEANARNDAYSSAMNASVQQGNEAGQQFFNQAMGARQQQLAELLKQRGLPLEEMQALMGLTQTPQFNQGPDYLGAAGLQGQYDMGAWGAQNKNRADTMQGLMKLIPFLM
jgi:hypothetical protein